MVYPKNKILKGLWVITPPVGRCNCGWLLVVRHCCTCPGCFVSKANLSVPPMKDVIFT